MSNEEIYKTSPQASFMSYTAWLEWQNCLVGDYARKLTVEIKKQSTEQNWSEPKPSAIQRLVTQTIIEERKKVIRERMSKRAKLSDDDKEDFGIAHHLDNLLTCRGDADEM